jgi:hypothetical protein
MERQTIRSFSFSVRTVFAIDQSYVAMVRVGCFRQFENAVEFVCLLEEGVKTGGVVWYDVGMFGKGGREPGMSKQKWRPELIGSGSRHRTVRLQRCHVNAKERVPRGLSRINGAFLLVHWSRALTGVARSKSVPSQPVCLPTLNLFLSLAHSHQSKITTSTASTCPQRQRLFSTRTQRRPTQAKPISINHGSQGRHHPRGRREVPPYHHQAVGRHCKYSRPFRPARKRHCTHEFNSLQHLDESSIVLRRRRMRVLWLPTQSPLADTHIARLAEGHRRAEPPLQGCRLEALLASSGQVRHHHGEVWHPVSR